MWGYLDLFFCFVLNLLFLSVDVVNSTLSQVGLRSRSMSMLSSSITVTGRLLVNLALPGLKLLSHMVLEQLRKFGQVWWLVLGGICFLFGC